MSSNSLTTILLAPPAGTNLENKSKKITGNKIWKSNIRTKYWNKSGKTNLKKFLETKSGTKINSYILLSCKYIFYRMTLAEGSLKILRKQEVHDVIQSGVPPGK